MTKEEQHVENLLEQLFKILLKSDLKLVRIGMANSNRGEMKW